MRPLSADAVAAGVELKVIKLNLVSEVNIAHAATREPDVLVLMPPSLNADRSSTLRWSGSTNR